MVNYPASIDNSISVPAAIDGSTTVSASIVNRLRDSILAVQTELGVRPSAAYTTVRNRLDTIEDAFGSLIVIDLAGDLSGSSSFPIVVGIQGNLVSDTDPEIGQALVWTGVAWAPQTIAVEGGAAIPGGSVTQVQFYDVGDVFGGDAGFTYNKTTNVLSVSDAISLNGSTAAAGNIRFEAPAASVTQWIKFSQSAQDYELLKIDSGSGNITIGGVDHNSIFRGRQTDIYALVGNLINFWSNGTPVMNMTDALISASLPIAIGTDPATDGAIRLAKESSIQFRNALNTLDMYLVDLDSSNFAYFGTDSQGIAASDKTIIGGNGGGYLVDIGNYGSCLFWGGVYGQAVSLPGNLQVGGAPAASGAIRLSNTNVITSSDGYSGVINIASVDSSANLMLGATSAGVLNEINNASLYASNTIFLAIGAASKLNITATDITLGTTKTNESTTTHGIFVTEIKEVSTTDDTITDIYTWTIPSDTTTALDVIVTAIQSDASISDAWKGYILFNNIGGAVSGPASVIVPLGSSGWVVTIDNSTTTGRVRVTGVAATNINWVATCRRQETGI